MQVFKNRSKEELIERFTKQFIEVINNKLAKRNEVHVAVSGGSTPLAFFGLLASQYKKLVDWKGVHFWWVDERFVDHDHQDNNFNNAFKNGLTSLNINFHRIKTEGASYDMLVDIYNEEVSKLLKKQVFDIVILGAGEDGHTASLFADDMHLIENSDNVVGTINPHNHQKRIGLNFVPLINADMTVLLLSGANKKAIFDHLHEPLSLPINYVMKHARESIIYLDFW